MKTLLGLVAALVAIGAYSVMQTATSFIVPPDAPPVVEFNGAPVVGKVHGGRVRLTYYMRRNASCRTDVHARWYSLDRNAFDARYSRTFEAAEANVSETMKPFSITLAVPKEAGRWAYAPVVRPGPRCLSPHAVYPPWALIDVP